ncbi:MAG TPA: hypothetical protein VNX66_08385 [Candidatus Sulfotelmatobacter sp.]|nr:hypothetical protein [Candidatus Sulfotelmatobacter sp.]
MSTFNRRWSLAAVVVLTAGAIWFAVREYRCKVRGSVFARQVESIEQDASKELKIGADEAVVARFFRNHGIPFSIVDAQAYGALRTSGCAPFGCGTDIAFIMVQVKLDTVGAVAEAPKVTGMYKDCL